MTIKDQMINYANDTVKRYGSGKILTRMEIIDAISLQYGTNRESIIPSDYCYNRFNNDPSVMTNPLLFEYIDRNTYKCLGTNYNYNGKVYHKPKGGAEIAIGFCKNGVKVIGESSDFNPILQSEKSNYDTHKTPRDPGNNLRFLVMKRDNYKCQICGDSPAKNPQTELHIDHIVPWSKGGETVLDNLQTLCSKCNMGKTII